MATRKEVCFSEDSNGCFICTSHAPNSSGYPLIREQGKRITVARVMYKRHKGSIPEGLLLRHTCDNTLCINPAHLITGTDADNMKDRDERHRGHPGTQRLKHTDIVEIREDKKSLHKDIATRYGVSREQITMIKNFKRWK